MICVYPADCTNFSNNGSGSLTPLSAVVTETLNGEYELQLEHPIDEAGKWSRLIEGYILRAPVPSATTPRVILPDTGSEGAEVWRVYSPHGEYYDGLDLRTGPGYSHSILVTYRIGTLVQVVDKSDDTWYEIVGPDGKRGYVRAAYLTFDHAEPSAASATSSVILQPRRLRDQPFRIYRVVPELDKVTVYARHIFYDLMDNMTPSCTMFSPQAPKSITFTASGLLNSVSPGAISFTSSTNTSRSTVCSDRSRPIYFSAPL